MSLKSTIWDDGAPVSQAESSAASGDSGRALRQYPRARRADRPQDVYGPPMPLNADDRHQRLTPQRAEL